MLSCLALVFAALCLCMFRHQLNVLPISTALPALALALFWCYTKSQYHGSFWFGSWHSLVFCLLCLSHGSHICITCLPAACWNHIHHAWLHSLASCVVQKGVSNVAMFICIPTSTKQIHTRIGANPSWTNITKIHHETSDPKIFMSPISVLNFAGSARPIEPQRLL